MGHLKRKPVVVSTLVTTYVSIVRTFVVGGSSEVKLAIDLRRFDSLKNYLEDMLTIAGSPIDRERIREQLTAIEAAVARCREQFSL
jgi:hypothetical protein